MKAFTVILPIIFLAALTIHGMADSFEARKLDTAIQTGFGEINMVQKCMVSCLPTYIGYLTDGRELHASEKSECFLLEWRPRFDEAIHYIWYDKTDYFQLLKNAYEAKKESTDELPSLELKEPPLELKEPPVLLDDGRKIYLHVRTNGSGIEGLIVTKSSEGTFYPNRFSLWDNASRGLGDPKIHGIAQWGTYLLALLSQSSQNLEQNRIILLKFLANGELARHEENRLLDKWCHVPAISNPLWIKVRQTPEQNLAIDQCVQRDGIKIVIRHTIAGDLSQTLKREIMEKKTKKST